MAAVAQRLKGAIGERFIGGAGRVWHPVLRFAGQQGRAGAHGQAALTGGDLALAVTDLILIPTWVVGGILLWQRRAFGYLTGAGLLFQASMLFVGLLVFFLLQPMVAAVPFPMEDFVVILVMSLVCFVPLGRFVRGVLLRDSP